MYCLYAYDAAFFSVDIDTLTVLNWQFHQQRGTGWKCIPSPNENGVISLDSALGWLHWTGSSGDPITFDIGVRGVQMEKMEFTGTKSLVYDSAHANINYFSIEEDQGPGLKCPVIKLFCLSVPTISNHEDNLLMCNTLLILL